MHNAENKHLEPVEYVFLRLLPILEWTNGSEHSEYLSWNECRLNLWTVDGYCPMQEEYGCTITEDVDQTVLVWKTNLRCWGEVLGNIYKYH